MSESFEIPDLTPAPSMRGLRVAVLGAGKMGGILLQAFLKNNLLGTDQIFATVQHAERAQALSAQFGLEVTTDNLEAARQADVILLGVKPIQVPALIDEIKDALTPKKMLLSFAASVKTRSIEDAAGCELAVIRAMPNTPAMLAAGITALCGGRFVSTEQMAVAQKIFHTVGKTVVVDEKHHELAARVSGRSLQPQEFIHDAFVGAKANRVAKKSGDRAELAAVRAAAPRLQRHDVELAPPRAHLREHRT